MNDVPGMNDLLGRKACARVAAVALAVLLAAGLAAGAHAEDHLNSAVTEPTPIQKWFLALHKHHDTWGCCGYHQDCWETDARLKDGHWEAYYRPRASAVVDPDRGARWIREPDDTVEDREELPSGHNMAAQPVLCAGPWYMRTQDDPIVYCFVPPEELY